MKLVFIYGPPASGKYTTGKELAKITNYKFFHNHLTVPAADAIFLGDEEKRLKLLKEIRWLVLTRVAQEGVNTIFTMAYSGRVDDEGVEELVKNVEKYGGEVCFAQLYAPKAELLKRVGNVSRRKMKLLHKFTTKKRLLEHLDSRDHYASVKYEHLLIDTAKSSAKQSAKRIVEYFNLV